MGAVSLYDSEMEDGARLDALSLVMKGERLPRGTRGREFPSWVFVANETPEKTNQRSAMTMPTICAGLAGSSLEERKRR